MVFASILLVALAAQSTTSSVAQAAAMGRVAASGKPDFSGQWVLVNSTDSTTSVAHELTCMSRSRDNPFGALLSTRRS